MRLYLIFNSGLWLMIGVYKAMNGDPQMGTFFLLLAVLKYLWSTEFKKDNDDGTD